MEGFDVTYLPVQQNGVVDLKVSTLSSLCLSRLILVHQGEANRAKVDLHR